MKPGKESIDFFEINNSFQHSIEISFNQRNEESSLSVTFSHTEIPPNCTFKVNVTCVPHERLNTIVNLEISVMDPTIEENQNNNEILIHAVTHPVFLFDQEVEIVEDNGDVRLVKHENMEKEEFHFPNEKLESDQFLKELSKLLKMKNMYLCSFYGISNVEFMLFELPTTFLKTLNITDNRKDELSARICSDIASGLSFLHHYKIAHGFIHPQNVYLLSDNYQADDVCKLTRYNCTSLEYVKCIDDGVYVSPEIRVDGEESDLQSDIYAAGILFYEIFSREKLKLNNKNFLDSRKLSSRIHQLISRAIEPKDKRCDVSELEKRANSVYLRLKTYIDKKELCYFVDHETIYFPKNNHKDESKHFMENVLQESTSIKKYMYYLKKTKTNSKKSSSDVLKTLFKQYKVNYSEKETNFNFLTFLKENNPLQIDFNETNGYFPFFKAMYHFICLSPNLTEPEIVTLYTILKDYSYTAHYNLACCYLYGVNKDYNSHKAINELNELEEKLMFQTDKYEKELLYKVQFLKACICYTRRENDDIAYAIKIFDNYQDEKDECKLNYIICLLRTETSQIKFLDDEEVFKELELLHFDDEVLERIKNVHIADCLLHGFACSANYEEAGSILSEYEDINGKTDILPHVNYLFGEIFGGFLGSEDTGYDNDIDTSDDYYEYAVESNHPAAIIASCYSEMEKGPGASKRKVFSRLSGALFDCKPNSLIKELYGICLYDGLGVNKNEPCGYEYLKNNHSTLEGSYYYCLFFTNA
ncbi:hypothetical protein QTN25_003381 [Entamoeba marina]